MWFEWLWPSEIEMLTAIDAIARRFPEGPKPCLLRRQAHVHRTGSRVAIHLGLSPQEHESEPSPGDIVITGFSVVLEAGRVTRVAASRDRVREGDNRDTLYPEER